VQARSAPTSRNVPLVEYGGHGGLNQAPLPSPRNEKKEMRSSVTSSVVIAGFVAGLASFYGCSSGDPAGTGTPPVFGGTTGNSGTTSTAGSTATSGSGTGGSVTGTSGSPATGGSVTTGGSGTMAGSGPVGGAGGMSGGAGGSGAGTGGSAAGSGGGGGTAATGDITKVWKADACGKAYAGAVGQKISIPTMGVKDAMCAAALNNQPKCGPWGTANSTWCPTPLMRDYWVYLPTGYDPNKAYPLLFEGPGCGGNGGGVYGLSAIKDSVIRIGLSPANPQIVGHGTNPGQGCFDDKEGDDSVDWVFYENLYDKLNSELCFDRNRVFTAGDSSGSWFSNELGCKYAGDSKRPVRGVLPNTGGLPNQYPLYEPTCTKSPMAGMWVHEVNDPENPFSGNKFAISRAMTVNGCTGSTDYDDAVAKGNIQDFPIGGGNDPATCKLIKNCPALYPLVVCALPGNMHASHPTVVEPGFPTFLKQFNMGAFLTQ